MGFEPTCSFLKPGYKSGTFDLSVTSALTSFKLRRFQVTPFTFPIRHPRPRPQFKARYVGVKE